MARTLTHGGLFDGIGGFSLGAQRAGIRTKWAVEGNKYRQQILNQHFPKVKLYGKIQSCTNLPYVDIITGGFPCQNISAAGRRDGIAGDRSSLWTEFYRIIYESRPRYIIIENSPFLRISGLEYILYDLAQSGYDAQWKCISAREFGYRHKRERLFIIAYTSEKRLKWPSVLFRSIDEVPKKRWPKQAYIPVQVQRIDRNTDSSLLRVDGRFSEGLDKNRIEAIGDTVLPEITCYLYECIKIFDSLNYQS